MVELYQRERSYLERTIAFLQSKGQGKYIREHPTASPDEIIEALHEKITEGGIPRREGGLSELRRLCVVVLKNPPAELKIPKRHISYPIIAKMVGQRSHTTAHSMYKHYSQDIVSLLGLPVKP